MDGAKAMLLLGRQDVKDRQLETRIKLVYGYLPEAKPPLDHYDTIISNSLLHHLNAPVTLWKAINTYASPGCSVFVMDLLRPNNEAAAKQLVETYAAGEPEILRSDFLNSLRAAYTIDEVGQQLHDSRLDALRLEVVSDRHWIVSGNLPG
jgi:hypothetical protein